MQKGLLSLLWVALLAFAATVDAKKLVVRLSEPPLAETAGFSRSWLSPRGSAAPGRERLPLRATAPFAAHAARAAVDAQQSAFLAELARPSEIFHHQQQEAAPPPFQVATVETEDGKQRPAVFGTLVNAVVVDIGDADEASAIAALKKLLPGGVVSVSRERRYRPMLFTSLDQIGAPAAISSFLGAADALNAGAGMRIAVIDAGLWAGAEMFRGDGMAWPADIPSPGLGDTTNTNAKIPVSRGYVESGASIPAGENWTYPGPLSSSHGIHCGSTAGGRNATGTLGAFSRPIVGVAPAAWLFNYKIFYTTSSGSSVSAGDALILQAFEDVLADGADVCSNSWGSDAFYNSNYALEVAAHNLEQQGVVMLFAAGNEGPYPLSASWHSGIRVAAVTSSKSVNGCLKTQPFETDACSEYMVADFSAEFHGNFTYPLAATTEADILGCTDLSASYDFTGKAVVLKRGTCDFVVKAQNALGANAAAVIIFNHEAGGDTLITMSGTPQVSIPAIFIGNTIGTYVWGIANATDLSANVTLTTEHEYPQDPDVVADFSSRGPTVSMQLGPDIAAPGVNIFAAGFPRDGYNFLQGTSMATPHVSGAAALLMQHHPSWTVDQVKAAMMNTAEWKSITVSDGSPAQPLDMGAGRLAVDLAIDPPLLISPPSASFGVIPRAATPSIAVEIANMLQTSSRDIRMRVLRHTGKGTTDVSPSFAVSPTTATVSAGGSVSATVTVVADSGETGDIQAFLVIESSDGSVELGHAPIWGRLRCTSATHYDVLLLNADLSACSYAAVSSYYENALTAAGLTWTKVTMNCTTGELSASIDELCYDMLVMVSGDNTYVDFITLFGDLINTVAHMGVPVLLAGQHTAANFIPSGSQASVYSAYLFDVYLSSFSVAVSGIKGTTASPSRFSAFTDTLASSTTAWSIYHNEHESLLVDSTYSMDQVTSFFPELSLSDPKPLFDTIGLASFVGFEHLSSDAQRATLIGLLFDHATEQLFANQTAVTLNYRFASFTLDHSSGLDAVYIDWGDTETSSSTTKGVASVALFHTYATAGNFSITMVAKTSLGRYFSHQIDVTATQAPDPPPPQQQSSSSSIGQPYPESVSSFSSAAHGQNEPRSSNSDDDDNSDAISAAPKANIRSGFGFIAMLLALFLLA